MVSLRFSLFNEILVIFTINCKNQHDRALVVRYLTQISFLEFEVTLMKQRNQLDFD